VYNPANHRAYAVKGNKTTEFFRYNPDLWSWDTLASVPLGKEAKAPGDGCKGIADGNRFIYMVKGKLTLGFWRYDVVTDSWTQLEDVPRGPRNKKVAGGSGVAYSVNHDTGYVYLLKGGVCEFYRYNTVSNVWDSMPDAPAGQNPKYGKGSWLVDDGDNRLFLHKAKYHELWSFNTTNNTWDAVLHNGMPFVGRESKSRKSKDGGCASREGRYVYAFKGGREGEFWRYSLDRDAWTEKDAVTYDDHQGHRRRRHIKAGASLAAHNDTNNVYEIVFALVGSKTRELLYYELDLGGGGSDGPTAARAITNPQRPPVVFLKPDPVSSRLACVEYHLTRPGLLTTTVQDVTGRVLLTRTVNASGDGSFCLDLRSIGPGVYVARLETAGFAASQKLVITR
jgi:hypothetical protein